MKLNGLGYFQGPGRPSSPQDVESSEYGVGPAQYLCSLFQQSGLCFIFPFCNGGEVVSLPGTYTIAWTCCLLSELIQAGEAVTKHGFGPQ